MSFVGVKPIVRVTLVTETFFPQINGVSRTLGKLVDHLRSVGDTVQVIHPDYGAPPASPWDVTLKAVPLPFYKEVVVPLPPFGKVDRAVREFRPDLIHIATEATLGLHALLASRRWGAPVVSSFHTNFDQYTSHYRLGFIEPFVRRYLRWFHNRTRATFVPTPGLRRKLEAMGFERLHVWPRGVDACLFRPDRPHRETIRTQLGFGPETVVVGHVGRLAPEKNCGYLAEALEILGRHHPEVGYLVVGDGPIRAELERNLGPRGRFVGFRTGEDLADHYAACDLFAFAGLTETFGNVLMEAMASGLPVVALAVGGPADVVQDGITGRLLPGDTPPERFATALAQLIEHPDQRRQWAKQARQYAETQTWSAIMQGLRDHYLRVCAESSNSSTAVARTMSL